MRGVQKCTCAGASLRSKNYATLHCIILDTATEAAEKTGDNAVVEVSIHSDKYKLMITVANSILQSVLNVNSELKTSKKEAELHGFGVKSIKTIAEKYGGSVDFYEENLTFFCRVILCKEVE